MTSMLVALSSKKASSNKISALKKQVPNKRSLMIVMLTMVTTVHKRWRTAT